jgi:transcriptional regulator with XRE-family HTH domain
MNPGIIDEVLRFLEETGTTQTEMSIELGMAQSQLSRILKGESDNRESTLKKLRGWLDRKQGRNASPSTLNEPAVIKLDLTNQYPFHNR